MQILVDGPGDLEPSGADLHAAHRTYVGLELHGGIRIERGAHFTAKIILLILCEGEAGRQEEALTARCRRGNELSTVGWIQ